MWEVIENELGVPPLTRPLVPLVEEKVPLASRASICEEIENRFALNAKVVISV